MSDSLLKLKRRTLELVETRGYEIPKEEKKYKKKVKKKRKKIQSVLLPCLRAAP